MEFNYGGCGGNGNNFETLHDCEKMCSSAKGDTSTKTSDCTSPADGGLCMAYMERYAFNPATRICDKFVYGGCGGNGNRYSSVEECEEHCANSASDHEQPHEQQQQQGQEEESEEVCLLPKDIGPCRSAKMRFFFNAAVGACQVFLYGGCAGNANNFETVAECVRRCEEDDAYQPSIDSTAFTNGSVISLIHSFFNNSNSDVGDAHESELKILNVTTMNNIESSISSSVSTSSTSEHDTRMCGVPGCPQDCGFVRVDGQCFICRCSPSPFVEPPVPEPTL